MEQTNKITEAIIALCGAIANKPIEFRTGAALPLQEPDTVNISGVLNTPAVWLQKKANTIDISQAHVEVDREQMTITLYVNEHNHYKDIIKGSLVLSPEFQKFGINSGKYMTGLELSDLIRMNRSYFGSKAKAMELVSICRNFKANVNRQIEASDDNKGNRSVLIRQTVESNQPPQFNVVIPIFRGCDKSEFTVEIDIDPDTLSMTLVSPDAKDIIDDMRDKLIDGVLNDIMKIYSKLAIIHI